MERWEPRLSQLLIFCWYVPCQYLKYKFKYMQNIHHNIYCMLKHIKYLYTHNYDIKWFYQKINSSQAWQTNNCKQAAYNMRPDELYLTLTPVECCQHYNNNTHTWILEHLSQSPSTMNLLFDGMQKYMAREYRTY